VGGGLIALTLAVAIVVLAARAAFVAHGPLKVALTTVLAVWVVASMVDTTEENRATWLLLGMIALAGRLAECFPDGGFIAEDVPAPGMSREPAN
jgi:hypothetical protein